jgi:Fur family transcriptional regulator, ferric uptake regulator
MTSAALFNTVRAHGLRVSTARRCVLDALLAADEPLTAEEIANGADVASVYRNLDTLEEIGIVRHVHLGHGPGRYVLRTRSGGWATCDRCGHATLLGPEALQRIRTIVRATTGYDAGFGHFPIVGTCPECMHA